MGRHHRLRDFKSCSSSLILPVDWERFQYLWVSATVIMENPVDRTIRLMALAAGVVCVLVIVVFQFI